MILTLETHATEKSTYVIDISFFDEANNPVVPQTGVWSLTDKLGTVINSRSSVTIPSLAAIKTLVLSGADLALQTAEAAAGLTIVKRVVTVEWTYNSTLGTGLPGKAEVIFFLDNMVKVA
jgi:hypothetical protein